MENKIAGLIKRFSEVESQLSSPEVVNDRKRYKELTQEHAYLAEVKETWEQISATKAQLHDNRELLKIETDVEFSEVLREDSAQLEKKLEELDKKIHQLLVPPDPNDSRNTILELRAGTGGDEAA